MCLIERLLQALKNHGARAIFGIPGDYALPIFSVLEHSPLLPLYTLSHEPAVAFAADAAARLGGGIGVAVVTYGAGALNLLNGVAAAYAERSPLVVISAAPPRAKGRMPLGLHHQVRNSDSQMRIFKEVTCAQALLDDPLTTPTLISETLAACVTQSLPVYFEIPSDMALQPCTAVEIAKPKDPDLDAIEECLADIVANVQSATSPVVMLGVEVRRYGLEKDVAELSQRINIPIVTSFMGRGVAANQPIVCQGSYLGLAGNPEITTLVENSDALILLGVILCDTNFGLSTDKLDLRHSTHAFGGQVRVAHHIYQNIPLRNLIHALFKHVPLQLSAKPLARQPAFDRSTNPIRSNDDCATPSNVVQTINELFMHHEAMPVVCDVGDSLFASLEIEQAELVAQAYYASMGFAVPAAIGVQAATGLRPLVLVGDGAFQMTGWELGNCQRYGFDPIVIVFNNRSWEMLRTFSPGATYNDLSDWHFADIASSLGGKGVRVQTLREFSAALEQAWHNSGKFQLIEVMLDRGVISDTLRRFVQGFGVKQHPFNTDTNHSSAHVD